MRTILTTAEFAAKDHFRRWREAIGDQIAKVELSRYGDWPFEGLLEAATIGDMQVSRITQTASLSEITADGARKSRRDDILSISLKLDGTSHSTQHDRSSIQRTGDLVVLENRPGVLASQSRTQSLFLEIPRERLERLLGPARQYTSLTVEGTQASTSLVNTFFRELVRVHDQLTPETAVRMSAIGVDLVVASIAERLGRETLQPLHGTIVVQRAKAYVETNLGDPDLDPPRLAAAMGVSLRRLQQLFQERGQHVSDWIWQRRLETAASRLANPGYDHLPIGLIAYGCGFASQAHFSRRFRDCYGMTPSDFHRGAGPAGSHSRLKAVPADVATG